MEDSCPVTEARLVGQAPSLHEDLRGPSPAVSGFVGGAHWWVLPTAHDPVSSVSSPL